MYQKLAITGIESILNAIRFMAAYCLIKVFEEIS